MLQVEYGVGPNNTRVATIAGYTTPPSQCLNHRLTNCRLTLKPPLLATYDLATLFCGGLDLQRDSSCQFCGFIPNEAPYIVHYF